MGVGSLIREGKKQSGGFEDVLRGVPKIGDILQEMLIVVRVYSRYRQGRKKFHAFLGQPSNLFGTDLGCNNVEFTSKGCLAASRCPCGSGDGLYAPIGQVRPFRLGLSKQLAIPSNRRLVVPLLRFG